MQKPTWLGLIVRRLARLWMGFGENAFQIEIGGWDMQNRKFFPSFFLKEKVGGFLGTSIVLDKIFGRDRRVEISHLAFRKDELFAQKEIDIRKIEPISRLDIGQFPKTFCHQFMGHPRRETLKIDGIAKLKFRLEEELVTRFIGKANDFAFDRRAITGPHSFDHAIKNGGLIQIIPNDL